MLLRSTMRFYNCYVKIENLLQGMFFCDINFTFCERYVYANSTVLPAAAFPMLYKFAYHGEINDYYLVI